MIDHLAGGKIVDKRTTVVSQIGPLLFGLVFILGNEFLCGEKIHVMETTEEITHCHYHQAITFESIAVHAT